MNLLSHRRLAWSVPAAVIAAVVTAALLPGVASGKSHPRLAPRTAAELLVAVQGSTVEHLSGTIVETARLGLPDLPGSDRSASLNWQSLITGSHTANIWVDGPDHQRVALLGQLAESDIVHNGKDVWTYSSRDNAVSHATLREDSTAKPAPVPTDAVDLTPQAAADKALKAIDPSTKVTVDMTAEVAGRPAYTLSLTPRDARSTVRVVLIAVDSEYNVPLRVQVFGSGVAAAFETAFTDISFARPNSSVFHFSPPAHAVVTEQDLGGMSPRADASETSKSAQPKPAVIGNGWTSILTMTQPKATQPTAGGRESRKSTSSLLDQLTSALPNGDRLMKTSLINALLTSDGRLFVGAVKPELLQKAALGSAG
ncbi:MAG: hypothetical protein QOJ79_2456 [Actinomycetota bacterium]|jgi:outer membrane lipoprotein-sorting protein|nr:hypothetical protein [Actinomycetota bacterium]